MHEGGVWVEVQGLTPNNHNKTNTNINWTVSETVSETVSDHRTVK